MSSKIITRSRIRAAAFGAAAVAASAFASPVVVTPGASAGYLYFAPSTGGGGGTNQNPPEAPNGEEPTVGGECAKATTIGQKCIYGDGTEQYLAGLVVGEHKKIFVSKNILTIEYPSCGKNSGTNVTNSASGVDNAKVLEPFACTITSICGSGGNTPFTPSLYELGVIFANKNNLPIEVTARRVASSNTEYTVSGTGVVNGRAYYTLDANGVQTKVTHSSTSAYVLCVRGLN